MKKILLIIITTAILFAFAGTLTITQSDEESFGSTADELKSATGDIPTSIKNTVSSEVADFSSEVMSAEEAESETNIETFPDTSEEAETKSAIEPELEKETEVTDCYDENEIHSVALYSPSDFKLAGVIYWGEWKWTYYSEKVLPGYGLDIPGRCVDDNGYVCDEDGYICVASSVLSYGTVINTPFGKSGKVYDSGCASDVVDVYVSW